MKDGKLSLSKLIGRAFPEKRLFIRSDDETRYIRLRPAMQLGAWVGSSVLVGWSVIATAIILMDNVGAGSLRDQAERKQALYEARLNEIATERDRQIMATAAAQERFAVALNQVSAMQSALLASEGRRRELETGIEVIQATLRNAIGDRDSARDEIAGLMAEATRDLTDIRTDAAHVADMEATIAYLADALSIFAVESAEGRAEANQALRFAAALKLDIELMEERNDRIYRQLEEAVANSLEPLGKMFATVKLPTDRIIEELRRGYAGQGGPLMPISFSTKGLEVDADTVRANALLNRLDELALHRIAAARLPFGTPVAVAVHYTSGFGYRTDPVRGGRRLHKGADWAGAYGTPIIATAEGEVIAAGWTAGYGRLVKIRHASGFETRYAHMAKIRVIIGQKVSRGERIGDMGNSGRSTGTHIHYEVRRNGEAVNPMTYIKAARDVF